MPGRTRSGLGRSTLIARWRTNKMGIWWPVDTRVGQCVIFNPVDEWRYGAALLGRRAWGTECGKRGPCFKLPNGKEN